ncbi:MAG TPA: glycosyltransferase [Rickettsiales bacterium]|nr:glycosyltransferase [Rickettsiales bacterium]
MRIAYVLGRFPVMSETFIGNEIRAMEAAGHNIVLSALHKPEGSFQSEDNALMHRTLYFAPLEPREGWKLIRRYALRILRLLPFMLRQTTEPYFPFLVHAAHLADHIRKENCTHVHAHFGWGAATYAIAAARLAGLPVTFTCHGSDVYARPVDLRVKCKAASAVIGVAPSIVQDLQKLAGGTPCELIYCGVDTARFKPIADPAQNNGRWLFCGRLIDCKGSDDILAAWKLMHEEARPQLDIIGDGPLRESLERYVAENNLEEHVHFLGTQPAAWIARNGPCYFASITAFRQGSDGSRDTAPMVLKEAIAMGLPVVTTRFADMAEVVDENCAVLCPPAVPQALAEAVIQVQKMPDDARQKMGRAGRVRAETRFSAQQQAAALTQLFERCARSR